MTATGAVYVLTAAPELPRTYCAASPHSAGPGARIGYGRSLSHAANTFELTVTAAVPDQTAIFVYAEDRSVPIPLGDGALCISGGTLHRLGVTQLDASGDAVSTVDFDLSSITPSSTWHFQCWFRDPQAMGAGFNLSDGLRVRFCP